MTRQFLSSLTLVLASAFASAPAVAQTVSFGSASPAVSGPDSVTPKPAAKPDAKSDSMPKPEFKPSYNFSAWLFGAYNYQTDSATKANNNDKPFSKFSVDRAYLTFRGQVAPDWGFRVTTDVVTLGGGAGYSGLVIRLKYAYLTWDYLHAETPMDMSAWARIGQLHTVAIDNEERFWARWIQKTGIEYWGIQPSSADAGVATQLTLPSKWGVAYLVLDNGGGYSAIADQDRYKDAALRLSLTPMGKSTGMFKTLELNGWYQVGRSQNAFNTGPNNYKPGLENNAYGIFFGNADPRLSFGFDYAERMTQTIKPTDSTVVGNTAKLYDGFVTVRPSLFKDPKGTPWGLIFRYDKYQANTNNDANRTLFIGTIFLDVAKNSSLGLTYQDDVAHDATKTSDQLKALEKSMWQLNWQVTF